ncbi:hypothetical protein DEJ48_39055 [Streptomyces venezuelae]|uniref:Uncharacterized protein n=1 Tax=Streptomyces venezuelae TaxID=54571 RepID=A0A5P2CCX9_STRVZ|nr:hypothetical protein DEJ48_39055 [Streptomyces venezuelae]
MAHSIDVADCTAGKRYCSTEPGREEHNARDILLIAGGFGAVFPGVRLALRGADWRPLLGLPAGAVVGSGIALSIDQEQGIWLLTGGLVVICSVLVIPFRRLVIEWARSGSSGTAG